MIRAWKWPIPPQTIDSPRIPIIRAPHAFNRFGEFEGNTCCISGANPVGSVLIYPHGERPTLTNACLALAVPDTGFPRLLISSMSELSQTPSGPYHFASLLSVPPRLNYTKKLEK